MNDPILQIVHVEDGTAVDSVMIGGHLVVENGRPTGTNLTALAAEAERLEPRLADLLAQNSEILAEIEQVGGRFCGALSAELYRVDRHGVHLE